jgi:hypothetical protein
MRDVEAELIEKFDHIPRTYAQQMIHCLIRIRRRYNTYCQIQKSNTTSTHAIHQIANTSGMILNKDKTQLILMSLRDADRTMNILTEIMSITTFSASTTCEDIRSACPNNSIPDITF